jgi:hypothetical protein
VSRRVIGQPQDELDRQSSQGPGLEEAHSRELILDGVILDGAQLPGVFVGWAFIRNFIAQFLQAEQNRGHGDDDDQNR